MDLLEDCGYYFIKRQGFSRKTTGTAGSILKIQGGFWQKGNGEGVQLDLSRRIEIGRCRSDGRGRETAGVPDGEPGGGAMAGELRTSPAFLEKGLRAMAKQTESTGMESRALRTHYEQNRRREAR